MKLYYTPMSPYTRKVLVCAHELGLRERISLVPLTFSPIAPDAGLNAENPLGKIPTLVLDEGTALFDSRVICAYLDELAGGRLVPAGAARWDTLRREAAADAILDAAVLARYELALRPEPRRWPEWLDGQLAKVHRGLDWLEGAADSFAERVELGTIASACALGYLDFRFAELGWRTTRPALAAWYEHFAARESMTATRHHVPA